MGLICRKGDLILEVGVLEAQQRKDDDNVMLNILNSGRDSYYANFYCESANTDPVTFVLFFFFFWFVWSLILSISLVFYLLYLSFTIQVLKRNPQNQCKALSEHDKYPLGEMKFGMCYLSGTSRNFQKMLLFNFAYEEKLLL